MARMEKHIIMRVILCALTTMFFFAASMPAYAVPITIDFVSRFIGVNGVLSQGASTSSLGLFSEMATASGSTELAEVSVTASQISDISLFGNTLTVNSAGSANASILPTVDPFTYLTQGGPSVSANSQLGLQFTIDNWASYDARNFLNGHGDFFSFSAVNFENLTTPKSIFSLVPGFTGGNIITDSRSGLLSPGTYSYVWAANGSLSFPDTGGVGPTSVFSSLTVQTVPEPATIILLPAGLAGLAVWHFRQRRKETV